MMEHYTVQQLMDIIEAAKRDIDMGISVSMNSARLAAAKVALMKKRAA